MKKILIIEPDEQFAGRLFQALLRVGDYQVSSTTTVREACLIVGRQEQDLAFIPLEDLEGSAEALRRLQPRLPLIITVPGADVALAPAQVEQVQGVLPRPRLAVVLPDLLRAVEEHGVPGEMTWENSPSAATVQSGAQNGSLIPFLQGTALPAKILTVLVSQGERLLGHAGTLTVEQARLVAERVGDSWKPDLTAQIQFMLLPSRTSDLQLYTRPAGAGRLLTLVSRPDTRLETLRTQAAVLARQMIEALGALRPVESAEATSETPVTVEVREQPLQAIAHKSFAIVWRTIAPLPDRMRIVLGRSLEQIAAENECDLSYLSIEERVVHLVVSCPSERSSGWISHLFKRGAEAALDHFGEGKGLWEKGYFAVESDQPVGEAELNLIKQKDT